MSQNPDSSGRWQAKGGDPRTNRNEIEACPPAPEPVLTLRCSAPAFGKRSRAPRMAPVMRHVGLRLGPAARALSGALFLGTSSVRDPVAQARTADMATPH
eukprot:PhM_4_TR14103/c5_g1_i1/m.95318